MIAGPERREHPRFPVRWKAATLLGQWHIREIHHGHTLDLSLGGANILCDHDDWDEAEEILIFLFPFTPQPGKRARHIEVCGKVVHVTPTSGVSRTRLRVAFTDYRNDACLMLSELLSAESQLMVN